MTPAELLPPDASTASTGLGLRYVGNDPMFVYAYSGAYSASTTAVTQLSFISGAGLIRGRMYVNGTIESGSAISEITTFTITFNGIIVCMMKAGTVTNGVEIPITVYQDFLIPPQTLVEVEVDSDNTDADRKSTITFTGRVYGL